MSDEDAIIAAAAAVIITEVASQHQRRPRRFWIRPSLLRGRGKYNTTEFMKDLLLDEVDELNLEYRCDAGFRNFFRMKSSEFENILRMIAPLISKRDTTFRQAVPARERFAVTLRFLATGDSYTSLSYMFKISKQSISSIIPDVCDAICSVLEGEVKKPQNELEWEIVAKKFNDLWNYPNCVGAIDGKHVSLQAPVHGGTEYYNYKSFHSIVLLAIVDASYNFIYANVGCQGRISDGGAFNNTSFKEQLDMNSLSLPAPRPLPGGTHPIQYVFVGDEAFQLSVNLMKPFSGLHNKGSKERVFNYRLSRARRVVENAFGILSSSFRILRKPMLLNPDVATKVTLTTIYLHNHLKKTPSRSIYCPNELLDRECANGELVPGLWRQDTLPSQLSNGPRVPRRGTIDAQNARNEFAEYFCSTQGQLHFQYDK